MRRVEKLSRDNHRLLGYWQVWLAQITEVDLVHWLHSVGSLLKLVRFLSLVLSRTWRVEGVSNIELLIMFEIFNMERLRVEKAGPTRDRPGRPMVIPPAEHGAPVVFYRVLAACRGRTSRESGEGFCLVVWF